MEIVVVKWCTGTITVLSLCHFVKLRISHHYRADNLHPSFKTFSGNTLDNNMLENLFNKDHRFNRASQAEDCETLLIEDKDNEEVQQSNTSRQSLPTLCLLLLWCSSLIIAVIIGVWIGSGHFADVNRLCTEHISQYCTKQPLRR